MGRSFLSVKLAAGFALLIALLVVLQGGVTVQGAYRSGQDAAEAGAQSSAAVSGECSAAAQVVRIDRTIGSAVS